MPRAQDRELLRAVGGRIRQLRQARGWTQEDLAVRTQLQPSAVSRIESGRAGFTLTMGATLARALGVSLGRIVDAPPPSDLTSDEAALIDAWRLLPVERRRALLEVVEWCRSPPDVLREP